MPRYLHENADQLFSFDRMDKYQNLLLKSTYPDLPNR